MNDILKLYIYSLKGNDDQLIKEKQVKFIRLIYGIIGINDKFTADRVKMLMGYPSLIIRKNEEKNISLFGVSIMNNDINTEIFEYKGFNRVIKKGFVLGLLFPSGYEKDFDNKLTESDRCELIYELINNCLGLNESKEGNYFLFKYIYLMQSRYIKYKNLYEEMKEILENSNKTNNNKYDLSKIKIAETECINFINYETQSIIDQMREDISNKIRKKNIKNIPILSEKFKNNKELINEKINKEFIGTVCDIIPDEIGKIKIFLIASNGNLSIFRLEYYTTYYTTKELNSLSQQKKDFIYKNINREKADNDDKNESIDEQHVKVLDFDVLNQKKSEKDFFEYIDELFLNFKIVLLENKEIINKKILKKTLIRYYALSKNKKCILKIDIIKGNMEKDIENNYFLPGEIHNYIEENNIINLIDIYRIKNEFNFLEKSSIIIKMKMAKAEKYLKEYLE